MSTKEHQNQTKFPWLYLILSYALAWVFWIPVVLTGENYQYAPDSNRLQELSIRHGGETRRSNFAYDASGNLVEDDRGDNTLRAIYNADRRMTRITP